MEVDLLPSCVRVADRSEVAEARRIAGGFARTLGFDETLGGRLAIVVTEMATNLIKHGGGGEILLGPLRAGAVQGVEVLALDRGAGMTSVKDALRDGHSTAGSAGTGLGAISRLADFFDIYSTPGRGTAVLGRFWSGRRPGDGDRPVAVGGACLPYVGEEVCGDGWAVEHRGGSSAILLVDGIGHGPIAAEAAHEAIRLFRLNASLHPGEMIAALHDGLRSTRGAAAAVTEIDPAAGVVRFSGVGNIGAVIVSPTARRAMISHNGTMGHAARKIAEFSYPWSADAVLVAHSDGLTTHWDLDQYPGLRRRDPSLIAGVLFRDFRRGRDDVTVVVGRTPAA